MLISQNYSEALLPLQCRSGARGAPYAVEFLFGWGLCGRACVTDVSSAVICNFISASNVPMSSQPVEPVLDIQKLWDIENVGIRKAYIGMSLEDKKVIDLWDNSCRKVKGHYELPIPWKDPGEVVPNNIGVASK